MTLDESTRRRQAAFISGDAGVPSIFLVLPAKNVLTLFGTGHIPFSCIFPQEKLSDLYFITVSTLIRIWDCGAAKRRWKEEKEKEIIGKTDSQTMREEEDNNRCVCLPQSDRPDYLNGHSWQQQVCVRVCVRVYVCPGLKPNFMPKSVIQTFQPRLI